MLPTPVEINRKLLKALDEDNNVKDVQTVLEVISLLETYPITRSALEQTRIGRTVNELRKKVNDVQLAKRAKQLVRNWKKIVDESSGINGEHSLSTPTHPAVSALQVSPAVSPALGRTMGLSPALPSSRPRTPLVIRPHVASPALAGGKPSTPTVAARVASPAVGARPQTPSLAGSQRVASPSLNKAHSTLLSSRTTSPALDIGKLQTNPCSPALRPGTPGMLAAKQEDNGRRVVQDVTKMSTKDKVKGMEDYNGSGRLTPSSASENSQDRLLVDRDGGVIDSDSQSSCKFTYSSSHCKVNNQHNHSMGVSLSHSSDKGSHKDQRDLSKTNAANRKRTREPSVSPPSYSGKLSRVESSSLSLSSHKQEKVINGCVKLIKKSSGAEMHRVGSAGSLPSTSTHMLSPFTPPLHEDSSLLRASILQRQESFDSRMSGQSFDRLSKDKHKVKTTEQLIEELQKKNNSAQVGTNIITQLRTNQIEKEKDVQGSVLPPGMQRRGRKNNRGRDDDFMLSIPSSDVPLSQAKTELVQRFLKTSDPSSTVDEYSPFKDDLALHRSDSALEESLRFGPCGSSYSKDNFDASFSASRQDRHEAPQQEESSIDEAPPETGGSQGTMGSLSLTEIYAQLPPVDDNIDWDAVDFYELPEPMPVTEETVNRLHTTKWVGVNGVYDLNGDWHGWHQTVSLKSYDNDMLHVLPYVDLDK